MYRYSYDCITGGLLLSDDPQLMSKEPRPVYAYELDLLGFNEHWAYKPQNEIPYMWSESNVYIYRGKKIAQVKGGNLYERPTLEVLKDEFGEQALAEDEELVPIDIKGMCEKNRIVLQVLEQMTVKKIYEVYRRREKQLDCFHVAFSGGKDSIVLLDLVKKALPKSSFIVLFGDTGMEFPDTYDLVDKVESQCKQEQITFARARSHFKPEESWRLFGPPSRTLRWCCTVHKAAPQTIKLREMLGKDDFVGLDFVGVRADESAARSQYEYENFGKKQKGQYSYNPILEWSSAEVWLYIYVNELPINATYKKGNSRAGCLLCPMGGGCGDWLQRSCYKPEVDRMISLIRDACGPANSSDTKFTSYVCNGGWNARKNGRDLKAEDVRYHEERVGDKLVITLTRPRTPWQEWLKTVSDMLGEYHVNENGDVITFTFPAYIDKTADGKYIKQALKKASSCVGCKVCTANCKFGCISFEPTFHISNCRQCRQCHEIDNGCLVYNSWRQPLGGTTKMKSINSFANHAAKMEWVRGYFDNPDGYFEDSGLGPNQVRMFQKFLRETGLIGKAGDKTALFDVVYRLGIDSTMAWALILSQFAYNAQFRWYIENMQIDVPYRRDAIADMLVACDVKKDDATSIINAYKRFCGLPIGTMLGFGSVIENGRQIDTLIRSKTRVGDEDRLAVLYSLYKFAEKCGGYYQFTLTRLMDSAVESEGVSPAKLFGFDRETMHRFVDGLAVKYPEFIEATFTHDLDKISLRPDKKSEDVLALI